MHGWQKMVSTAVQAHPLSTARMVSAPRPSAPAQHCTHACHMVSTPDQVHLLITARGCQMVSTPAEAPAQHCTQSCQRASTPAQVRPLSTIRLLPKGLHTDSAHPQHCMHSCQMVSTLAQAHQLSTVRTLAKACSAPAQDSSGVFSRDPVKVRSLGILAAGLQNCLRLLSWMPKRLRLPPTLLCQACI